MLESNVFVALRPYLITLPREEWLRGRIQLASRYRSHRVNTLSPSRAFPKTTEIQFQVKPKPVFLEVFQSRSVPLSSRLLEKLLFSKLFCSEKACYSLASPSSGIQQESCDPGSYPLSTPGGSSG